MKSDCVFCRIVRKEKKEKIINEDPGLIAFGDMSPRASHHLLLVPKKHYSDFSELMKEEPGLLLKIGRAVEFLVDQEEIRGRGYVWGFHAGGKQSVNHVHAQLLSGTKENELVL